MERNWHQFENFLRKSLEKSEITPSYRVLRKLKFRLWVSDYFSANLRKFNIFYSTAIVAGITFALLFPRDRDGHKDSRHITQKAQYSESKSLNLDETKEDFRQPETSYHSGSESGTPDQSAVLQTADNPTEIRERALPAAAFEADIYKGCAPLTVHFMNKSSLATGYEWDFGNGEKSYDENPEVTYDEAGSYEATLTITGTRGEALAYRQTVEVYAMPQADFEIDRKNSDGTNRTVQFKNTSENADYFSWFFGDAGSSSLANPRHTYKANRSYEVMLIAGTDMGCSDTARVRNDFIKNDYRLVFDEYFRPYLHGRSGDGYYDKARADASIFGPKHKGVKEYELTIWAPNGEVVFHTQTIKQGWNGYINGRLASQGTYTYEAIGEFPNGQAFHVEGKFNVILEDIY